MSLRSPLGRVKGLGAAGEGTGHWWAQRLTALALVPLTVWLVASLVTLAGADYAVMRAWLGSPVVAGLLILFLLASVHHAQLGLQVVIEDYVHSEGAKLALILGVKALAVVLGLSGTLAILSILFAG